MRYKNWKMYYTMSQPGPAGWILPLIPFHFTLVQNIKRDPFEQAVGIDQKTAMAMGGALGGPVTAFQYDWNMLPIGQQLWLEHLLSLRKVSRRCRLLKATTSVGSWSRSRRRMPVSERLAGCDDFHPRRAPYSGAREKTPGHV